MDNHIMCYGTIGTCQLATTYEIVERCLDWFPDLLVLIFVFLTLFLLVLVSCGRLSWLFVSFLIAR